MKSAPIGGAGEDRLPSQAGSRARPAPELGRPAQGKAPPVRLSCADKCG